MADWNNQGREFLASKLTSVKPDNIHWQAVALSDSVCPSVTKRLNSCSKISEALHLLFSLLNLWTLRVNNFPSDVYLSFWLLFKLCRFND